MKIRRQEGTEGKEGMRIGRQETRRGRKEQQEGRKAGGQEIRKVRKQTGRRAGGMSCVPEQEIKKAW